MRLRPKLAAVFMSVILVSVVTIGFFLYVVISGNLDNELKNRLSSIVGTTSVYIDGDVHQTLKTREMEKSDGYKDIRSKLQQVHKQNKDIEYIYTFARHSEKQVKFIVDAAAEDWEHIGSVYSEEIEPEMVQAFEGKIAVNSVYYTDEWGTFLSGYAPVRNSQGEVVAIVGADINVNHIIALKRRILIILVGICSGLLVAAILISFALSNQITRPIRNITAEITSMVDDMSQGRGDLTRRLKASSKDEVGDLARSFNIFIEKLAGIVILLANSSGKIEEGARQLSAVAEQQNQLSQHVSSIAEKVACGAQEQNKGILTTQTTIEQFASAIVQIARGAQEQASAVESTGQLSLAMQNDLAEAVNSIRSIDEAAEGNSEAAERGAAAMDAVGKGMGRIHSAVKDALESVYELDEGSRQISDIIEVIDNIAEQTNLLSLNAAIEAARAGENGRGFAVVADEVRRLAERSTQSTTKIAGIITHLSATIQKTVNAVKLGEDQVEKGINLVSDAGESLGDIGKGAAKVRAAVTELLQLTDDFMLKSSQVGSAMSDVAVVTEESSAIAEEMAASSDDIVNAVQAIAEVSGENVASSNDLASSMEQQSATMHRLKEFADSLTESAVQLDGIVRQFKTDCQESS